jgi:hypothetical protein
MQKEYNNTHQGGVPHISLHPDVGVYTTVLVHLETGRRELKGQSRCLGMSKNPKYTNLCEESSSGGDAPFPGWPAVVNKWRSDLPSKPVKRQVRMQSGSSVFPANVFHEVSVTIPSTFLHYPICLVVEGPHRDLRYVLVRSLRSLMRIELWEKQLIPSWSY